MDVLNLKKGELLNLKKQDLKQINIGLGWDITNGKSFDVDAFVLLFDNENEYLGKIYFGNLKQYGIVHCGDNLTGVGEGDDEVIIVDLQKLDPKVSKISVFANIFWSHKNTFADIDNAFIRLVNGEDGREIAKYNLSEQNRNYNAFHFANLIVNKDRLDFEVIAEGQDGSVKEIEKKYKGTKKKKGLFSKIFG